MDKDQPMNFSAGLFAFPLKDRYVRKSIGRGGMARPRFRLFFL